MWIPLLRNIWSDRIFKKTKWETKKTYQKRLQKQLEWQTTHGRSPGSPRPPRTPQGETGTVRTARLCLNNQYILMSLTLQWTTFLSSLWQPRNSTKYITPIFKLVIEICYIFLCIEPNHNNLIFLLIFSYCPELLVSLYPLIYYPFLWHTINLFLEIWHRIQVHSCF